MDRIADYEILQDAGKLGPERMWLAKPPSRLTSDPVVSLRTVEHGSSSSDFKKLVKHIGRYHTATSSDLIPVLEVGREYDTIFVASEHLGSGSLANPQPPLSRVEILRAVGRCAEGAHRLHEVGIAHGAIKPESILLGPQGARLGRVSIVQVLDAGLTVSRHTTISDIEYLAPELIQGRPASRATDIWAIAASLHRALTGRPIYPSLPTESPLAALRHILNNDPDLSDALRNSELRMIETALAADPIDRPRTAKELASQLFAEADRQARQA